MRRSRSVHVLWRRGGWLARLGLALGLVACSGRDGERSAAKAQTPSEEGARGSATPDAVVPALAEIEPSSLDADETVRFLPTFATLREGRWEIPIDMWVFEPEEDDLARGAVLELLGEGIELRPGSPDSEVIEANLRPFFIDNERGEHVSIRRLAHAVSVGPTSKHGRAHAVLEVPADDPAATGEGTPPWVELEVVMPRGDDRRFSAWSQLLPDDGISVISDIDDTIKITGVHDTATMMENTFLHPFRAVPGMPEAYARWAEQGVAFHYVSASPLPLLDALTRFAREVGFPRGTLALRPFRWKDGTAMQLLEPSEEYKREVIEGIVGAFEHRRFVLVGDTGERDPEIYASVAAAHPDRIVAVYLRDPAPGGTPGITERIATAFAETPEVSRRVIIDGSQLPASLTAG